LARYLLDYQRESQYLEPRIQYGEDRIMKTNVRMSQLTRGLLAVAIVGSGLAIYHGDAVAAISAGRHNLSATAGSGNQTTGAGGEICVFCHTPHGADVTVAGAPLWNKRFTSNFGGAFTPYASTTTLDGAFSTDGSVVGSTFLSGASLACLSCHDGTQAIDNLLNAPGSGGMDSTGGSTDCRGYTLIMGNNSNLNANGYLQSNANLGRDLSNDHPIGIRYCGGGPVIGSTGAACTDSDFVSPSNGTVGGVTTFWVDTPASVGGDGTGNRTKTDMLLYVRGFTTGANGPAVECASCHDVHSSAALFLRIANTNSAVCLACHVK
jgi:predicted CXXCH cytochrome family protein